MKAIRKAISAVLLAGVASSSLPLSAADAATPYPPYVAPDAPWLQVVNYYRAMSGLPPVSQTSDATRIAGATKHACYMLDYGISHAEDPTKPGYSPEGDLAASESNVAVSSAYGATARSHIDLWMSGPFHSVGILRAALKTVAFGKCDRQDSLKWHSGAALNVIDGLDPEPPALTKPILFPGNGSTTSLTRFVAETPNPVTLCGWTGSAGLPLLAMMPEDFSTVSSATVTGPNGPLETCALWDKSPQLVGSDINKPTARALLEWGNVLTVIPRDELAPGTYSVNVVTDKRTVAWSFTVDPAAATGVMPIARVAPLAARQNFTALTPFRLADSRISLRISKVKAGSVKVMKIAGSTKALPADIRALSANLTVLNPAKAGYMLVYNCTTNRPTATTVNYYPGEVTPNGGVFPLDASGRLCVYSSQNADLVIDVTGYFREAAALRYEGLEPSALVDTTTKLHSKGRLTAGQSLKVNVPAAGIGVPVGTTAVAISITGIKPDSSAFITAWPCGTTRPSASTVNPRKYTIKQNFAIVKLSSKGELCFYTPTGVHMKVDVLGWFKNTNAHMMVPTTPTRLLDTRANRNELNFSLGGSPLPTGAIEQVQLAGERGLPADASVIFVNFTVISPPASGAVWVWDCGTRPTAASINFQKGKTVSTGLQVQLSATGALCVQTSAATHVVMDITGWFV